MTSKVRGVEITKRRKRGDKGEAEEEEGNTKREENKGVGTEGKK